jgi:NIMA (never in mitosis gene a)-related kinase
VFLDEDNQVKLGDFGLAKMLDEEHLLANTYVGTPYYMSPEVLMDQPSTPQSDIWSLGCVVYELCALHPPFQAKSHMALSQKIREGLFPPIPAIYSSTLSKTITACLSINPSQRPTTATLLTLDVIKLALRDREIVEMQRNLLMYEENLHAYEQALRDREEQLKREFEAHKERFEADIYRRLELHFTEVIEAEVDRRVRERLEALQRIPAPTSPNDTSMNTPPPTVNGGSVATSGGRAAVRGPRSIRDSIISPLRESRQPFDDMSNHVFVPSSPLVRTAVDRSALDRSSPTANWQTIKPPVTSPARQTGVRNATAKARAMGGHIGRSTVQLPPPNNARVWDENIHGEDMPSPFLRKWERSDPSGIGRRSDVPSSLDSQSWRLSQ